MKSVLRVMMLSTVVLATTSAAAHTKAKQQVMKYKDGVQCACMRPHWYVAGSLGVSHLYDQKAPGTVRSVDENGPGADATLGYQFTRMWGGELGYTQYYNSRETSGTTVVARTSHFAVHANAVARYPIAHRVDALGKLGLAYAYAQKIFESTGAAGSSGSVSPYLGLGVAYKLTKRVDMIGQWSFVRGNNYTGSNTLYSLGVQCAIV